MSDHAPDVEARHQSIQEQLSQLITLVSGTGEQLRECGAAMDSRMKAEGSRRLERDRQLESLHEKLAEIIAGCKAERLKRRRSSEVRMEAISREIRGAQEDLVSYVGSSLEECLRLRQRANEELLSALRDVGRK